MDMTPAKATDTSHNSSMPYVDNIKCANVRVQVVVKLRENYQFMHAKWQSALMAIALVGEFQQ